MRPRNRGSVWGGVVVLLLIALSGPSGAQAQRGESGTRKRPRAGGEVESPLDRLKRRSPATAWKRLSRRWKQGRRARSTAPLRTKSAPTGHWQPTSRFGRGPNPFPAGDSHRAPPAATAAALTGHIGPLTAEQRLARAGTFRRQPQRDPIPKPSELKKISSILPYADYSPDLGKEDPCQFLCPRPDGKPCKAYPSGTAPQCPREQALTDTPYPQRAFPDSVFQWEASDLYHNPLYFEDPALERYGHTYPAIIQPFASAGLFGLQLFGLPYQMTLDPIHKRKYTLGWYRPGECAPKKLYQIPLNAHAAAVEGGAVTGLIFLFP